MEVKKFSEFLVNEARTNKSEVVDKLKKMLSDKPTLEMGKCADEKGIYSLAGMKKYLSEYKTVEVSNALHELQNDKKYDLKYIYVKVSHWDKSMPYWYFGLSESEAKKLKEEYEKEELQRNKEEYEKSMELRKHQKQVSDAKKEARKSAPKKAATKKSGEGVERKPGGTRGRKKKS